MNTCLQVQDRRRQGPRGFRAAGQGQGEEGLQARVQPTHGHGRRRKRFQVRIFIGKKTDSKMVIISQKDAS